MIEKFSPVSVAVALMTVCVTAAYNWHRRERKEQPHENTEQEDDAHQRSSPTSDESPESLISIIIATALAHFLVIDAETIESNIMAKSEIVLDNLQLRPQVTLLRNSSVGHVTGLIEKAIIKWEWGKWKDEAWIMGAVLVIKGLKVRVELSPSGETFFDAHQPSPLLETIKKAAASPLVEEQIPTKGALQEYIQKQVQMVLDSLRLNVEGFDLTIHLPAWECPREQRKTVITIGGQSVELASFRQHHNDLNRSNNDGEDGKLHLRFTIASLCANVINDSVIAPLPIMQPFSYTVEATRTGRRFGSLATDFEGVGWCPNYNDLVIHAGPHQIRALRELANLLQVLLPGARFGDAIKARRLAAQGTSGTTEDTASTFEFNLPSVTLIWVDFIKIRVGEVIISYRGGS